MFPLQVSELYDLVKKWDAVADTLPHIVERMTALKDLHEQGQCTACFSTNALFSDHSTLGARIGLSLFGMGHLSPPQVISGLSVRKIATGDVIAFLCSPAVQPGIDSPRHSPTANPRSLEDTRNHAFRGERN